MTVPHLGIDRHSSLGRVPSWVWVVLACTSALWLLGPRASGWQLLHLHKEDGSIFLQQWLELGWASFWEPYTGYQHLGPRTAAAVCATGPASWFAPCIGVTSGVVRFALALLASAVLVPYARTRNWGLAAGFLFVFIPVGQQEVLGNITNLRWFLDAGCLLVCLGLFRRGMGALATVVGFVGALSDPLVILLIPLALWRIGSAPTTRMALPAGGVLLGAAIHWLLLVPSARPPDFGWFVREPAEAVSQIVVRGGAVAQLGQNGTEVLLLVAIPTAVLAGLIPIVIASACKGTGGPFALVSLLMTSGFGVLACTLVFAPREELELFPAYQLGNGSRYSVAPAVLIGAATLIAASYASHRFLRWAGPALLIVAAIGDMTGDSYNSQGPLWTSSVTAARADCDGGDDSVTVQLTPTGVPTSWTADVACSWLTRR